MTAPFENIVQHLFHQPSLQSVTIDELERMTQQYPSFAAARFLLLKKMQDTNHPAFSSQLHVTTLYFNNPLWLQFLLQPQNGTPVTPVTKEKTAPGEEQQETVEAQQPAMVEIAGQFATTTIEEEHIAAPEEVSLPVTEEKQESVVHEATTVNDEPPASITEETTEVTAPAPDEPVVNEQQSETAGSDEEITILSRTEQRGGKTITIEDIWITKTGDEEALFTPPPPPGYQDPAADHKEEPVLPEEHSVQAVMPDEATSVADLSDDGTPTARDAGPAKQEDKPTVEEATPAHVPFAASLQDKIIIETPQAKDDLLFEPYHTIDYFASQGIKLEKLDPNPKDKLGKQLKSFTEWLKGMRRLPQASIEQALATNDEKAVISAAADSVIGKDVITEAMAEVYAKQGMHEKAAEVYRKLSLLNPAKSAYFASRIDALKH